MFICSKASITGNYKDSSAEYYNSYEELEEDVGNIISNILALTTLKRPEYISINSSDEFYTMDFSEYCLITVGNMIHRLIYENLNHMLVINPDLKITKKEYITPECYRNIVLCIDTISKHCVPNILDNALVKLKNYYTLLRKFTWKKLLRNKSEYNDRMVERIVIYLMDDLCKEFSVE